MKRSDCPEYTPEIQRTEVCGKTAAAMQKYAEAVKLYASTDLPLRNVAEKCRVSPGGLSAHIRRHFRPLLFARYDIDPFNALGYNLQVKSSKGQSLKTHFKYKDAIEACGDIDYIEYNISQIARLFDLDGPALASQLRVHYPDVIPNRERIRKQLGIADNIHRGARESSKDTYKEAVKMYRETDLTLPEVAEKCGVSVGGLTQFLSFYDKKVLNNKAERRYEARRKPMERTPGALSGNGRRYGPEAGTIARYAPALALYRNSGMTLEKIAEETGVTVEGFRGYISQWHLEDREEQKGSLRSARGKYQDAINNLKADPRPIAEVAAEFGFNPDVFRKYLKTHEPELATQQGMIKMADGKSVKRSSYEKYKDAIEEYASSAESLRTIAERRGIVYKSLMGFINRNCADERERHQKAVEKTLGEKLSNIKELEKVTI